jgi:hypothetical protein
MGEEGFREVVTVIRAVLLGVRQRDDRAEG